jgi:hypothetical protein
MESIDYNTERPQLRRPEYGRIIQDLVNNCLKIKDKTKRTTAANTIINIMAQLNSQQKNSTDFKQKLYDHLAVMADFELDIDWEFETPLREIVERRPDRIKLPETTLKYRHYGAFLLETIKKIRDYENPDEKRALIEQLANYMKRQIYQWKKELVSDEMVLKELRLLAGNDVDIPQNITLKTIVEQPQNQNQNQNQSKNMQIKRKKGKKR